MKRDVTTWFPGLSFLAAALMMWGGWMLIPMPVGPYMRPEDFPVITAHPYLFVWAFRFYFFGIAFSAVALVSLASMAAQSPGRVILWPGAAVACAGAFVGAIGAAFYYHHGYWGALEVAGKPADAAVQYVEALRVQTQYITCLVRFGRVFGGLGLLLVGAGLIQTKLLPSCLGWVGVIAGFAAIAVTMPTGDAFWVYAPVFHAYSVWLALTGLAILKNGLAPKTS